jgi:hypothetical protein
VINYLKNKLLNLAVKFAKYDSVWGMLLSLFSMQTILSVLKHSKLSWIICESLDVHKIFDRSALYPTTIYGFVLYLNDTIVEGFNSYFHVFIL